MLTHVEPEVILSLANLYRDGAHYQPSPALAKRLRDEVQDMFRLIPVPVRFVKGDEPFNTQAELSAHVQAHGELLMRDYEFPDSCVWLDSYNELRAVHDWFGHHSGSHAFTITGEVNAYYDHQHQLSEEQWPFIWNETVLANAYADHYGRIGWDKVVIGSII